MTCIVGIIEKEKVYIGGDSAGVAGLDVTIRKDTKVFKKGDFLIGYTSSFRMGQIIRFSFNPTRYNPEDDVYEYMCTHFINDLRAAFRNGGFLETDKSVESGGTFLVGFKGRLFTINNDFQVGESADDFDACGCGTPYALGCLEIDKESDYSPASRIERALTVAAKFSGGVRPPFVILNT